MAPVTRHPDAPPTQTFFPKSWDIFPIFLGPRVGGVYILLATVVSPDRASVRRGSKYDPLRDFLITSRQAELELSMSEVEEILGFALCRSAETPQFWANVKGRTRHTQYRSWRDAGYDAFPKPDRDSVRFVRIALDRRAANS